MTESQPHPTKPRPSGFTSRLNIITSAIGFIIVYIIFALRDFSERSNSIFARILGWILTGVHRTGTTLSSEYERQLGTEKELLERFQTSQPRPCLDVKVSYSK